MLPRHANRLVMAGNAPIRILSLMLLAACAALCQRAQPAKTSAKALPDAPSVLSASHPQIFRSLSDTRRLPLNTLTALGEGVTHYDPGHWAAEVGQKEPPVATTQFSFLARRANSIYHGSVSPTFLGRMTDAASGIILTRDVDGNRHLNSAYLLRVLTASVAHTAYRPYWRRSATQPISDFGSTVGSDAGMNVFHEFEPGILQIVKSHEPRFVSRIGGHVTRK
jgi:hypothetical protein